MNAENKTSPTVSTARYVNVVKHPLVQELLTSLRDYETPSSLFRGHALRLSRYVIYEAMSELGTRAVGVETPIGPAKGTALTDYVIFAPVLRAGLVLSQA